MEHACRGDRRDQPITIVESILEDMPRARTTSAFIIIESILEDTSEQG
jgi:hypothetical protein